MNNLEQNIKELLLFFGPCELHTIQQKLDLRGMKLSQNTIDTCAEQMVKRGVIREAEGFNDKAYKV